LKKGRAGQNQMYVECLNVGVDVLAGVGDHETEAEHVDEDENQAPSFSKWLIKRCSKRC
jgi:hypothetical protein